MRAARIGVLAVLLAAGGGAAGAAELVVSAGMFNVGKSPTQAEAGLEARFAAKRWGLRPMAGLSATEEGSFWAYGGLVRPVALSERWTLTPGFGVALYEPGDGKELGGAVEFRSSLELSVAVSQRARLGASIYHLSNAGLYDMNPGSNSIVVVIAMPLD